MLTLRWIGNTTVPVEAECITADRLADLPVADIERLAVQHGNRQEPMAEFFHVSGDGADGRIRLEGSMSRVKWVGAGMSGGEISVDGEIGTHLGSEMAGGRITVTGNAGDWVGAEMRGGLIQVHGNAGHQVGAAYRGSRRGMRGGTILIHGSAGNEIGSTMRRGLIAIGAAAGDFAGVSMIAGSVFLFGSPGIRVGAGMKRGTIAVLDAGSGAGPINLLPTFQFECEYRPTFMQLFLRYLRGLEFPVDETILEGKYTRYCGDQVALGKGEILIWQPS